MEKKYTITLRLTDIQYTLHARAYPHHPAADWRKHQSQPVGEAGKHLWVFCRCQAMSGNGGTY